MKNGKIETRNEKIETRNDKIEIEVTMKQNDKKKKKKNVVLNKDKTNNRIAKKKFEANDLRRLIAPQISCFSE